LPGSPLITVGPPPVALYTGGGVHRSIVVGRGNEAATAIVIVDNRAAVTVEAAAIIIDKEIIRLGWTVIHIA
jgi:hypothetical protein